MRTQKQWFAEYAESHQNKTNQKIHYFCVPIIFFSIVGILLSINTSFLEKIIHVGNPLIENWASVLLVFLLAFYLKLSFKTFLKMFVFSLLSVLGNYYLKQILPLFYTNLVLFILAWIGQFYGHKVEGKKPSFFKDLQFLLIGPAWVFEKINLSNN